jgi:hypothetical protein
MQFDQFDKSDEWFIHNRLYNANLDAKFKKHPLCSVIRKRDQTDSGKKDIFPKVDLVLKIKSKKKSTVELR